ncbi:MAG TPA: YtxH domain-containing protein [Terriglobia bacterium]|nr:YtxH domain-containing protein [Terriglobia bacterium]
MSDNNGGSKVVYFLAGLGIGAIVALLVAPQSGEETRDYLSRKADESREYVSGRGRELRRQAEGLVDKAKDMVTQQKEQLSAALEAGKQAYQDSKSR